MKKLENRVAIITGGARGIGKATAHIFAQNGATVVLWDLLPEVAETAAGLRGLGFEAGHRIIDTTDYEAVEAATNDVAGKYGHIDILVNNAGITRDASFLKMTHEQWQQVLDVNLGGVFNCTKAVAPHMVSARYGRILTASSVVGLYGNFGQTNYVASKAGVIGMSKVWAREFGKYGITANAVAPGFIKTAMTDAIPDRIKEQAISRIPARRLGEPEDIANAYLFLASEEASFVNGICLSVDGGAVS